MVFFDLNLADGEAPPQYVLGRLPQKDFWSPSRKAFLPADQATDMVMAMDGYPPGTPVDRLATVYLPDVPAADAVGRESYFVKEIDPATGRLSGRQSAVALDPPTPSVAVSVSLAVTRR